MKLDFKKTIIVLALISFTTLGYLFTQKDRYFYFEGTCFDTQTGVAERFDWNDKLFYRMDYQNKRLIYYKNQAK
jgi:hypothetical protein